MAANKVLIKKPFVRYDNPAQDLSNPNVPVYRQRINNDGQFEVYIEKYTNVYDYIQQSLEDTKIEVIMQKYAAGNIDILNQVNGMYGDFSSLPKSLADAQNMIINAKDKFNELPLEIREKYDNNVFKFYQDMKDNKNFNDDIVNLFNDTFKSKMAKKVSLDTIDEKGVIEDE